MTKRQHEDSQKFRERVAAKQDKHKQTEESGPSEKELNEVIESLCESKAAEFRMLGYSQVTGEDIWKCVRERYKENEDFKLHQVVNDILSLKAVHFMNWLMMRAYKLEEI